MFNNEYNFTGKHADYVRSLVTQNESNAEKKPFMHNWQLYLVAPVVGFLYKRKAEIDTNKSIKPTSIFPDQLIQRKSDFEFVYKLIMLLDRKKESDFNKRISKAFNEINTDAAASDEELYNKYVLGGVEVLYESIIQNLDADLEKILSNLLSFVCNFNDEYNVPYLGAKELIQKIKNR
jgi:hypothetical protein